METKQEVTKKFILGIALIVLSLALGKLVFIPVLFFPGSAIWWWSMIIVYIFSWIMLIPGIYLAGMEGYRLVTHKYKEYRRRTVTKVKEKGKKAATHVKEKGKKVKEKGKKAAKKTVKVIRHPVKHSKRLGKKIVRKAKKS